MQNAQKYVSELIVFLPTIFFVDLKKSLPGTSQVIVDTSIKEWILAVILSIPAFDDRSLSLTNLPGEDAGHT